MGQFGRRYSEMIKENTEREKDRQELLKQEFIKRANSIASNNTKKKSENTQKKKRVKSELEKQQEKTIKEQSAKIKEQERMIRELKQKEYEQRVELYNVKTEKAELQDNIMQHKKNIEEQHDEVKALKNKIKEQNKIINKQKSLIGNHNKEKEALERKIEGQKAHLNGQLKTIKKCRTRIDELIQGDAKSNCNYGVRVKELEKALKEAEASRSKQVDEYESKVKELQKQLAEAKDTENKQQDIEMIDKKNFGYIHNEEEAQYFINTLGEKYSLHNIEDGTPCKVEYINNNEVIVTKLYDEEDIEKIDKASNNKIKRYKKESLRAEKTIEFGHRYKVLIVGNKNNDIYIRELSKSNIEAEWFNSYINDEKRLKERLDRYDIVIALKKESTNWSYKLIKQLEEEDGLKYGTLGQASISDILYRVNYINENR